SDSLGGLILITSTLSIPVLPSAFRTSKPTDLSETRGHMSAVERLAASKLKYETSPEKIQPDAAQTCSPGQVRRSSSKKRPDSLLLYRQKCDLLKGSQKSHKMRLRSTRPNTSLPEAGDLEHESEGIKEKISTPEGTAKECSSHATTSQSERTSDEVTEQPSTKMCQTKTSNHLTVPGIVRRPGKGVNRSHSDISSRYSKNFADFDAFFKYCGLDSEVIQSLGKENFSASSDEITSKIRSISVSSFDDGFSRNSDSDSDEGRLEHELHKKKHQGTSVIERNARIIKWLYSCKNAKETGKKFQGSMLPF
uniref:Family with sequence similarity 110 member C n=1 Tax=Gouania willdenowi TaxID=441366 RepID=A0A8C5HLQ1_GOUWI